MDLPSRELLNDDTAPAIGSPPGQIDGIQLTPLLNSLVNKYETPRAELTRGTNGLSDDPAGRQRASKLRLVKIHAAMPTVVRVGDESLGIDEIVKQKIGRSLIATRELFHITRLKGLSGAAAQTVGWWQVPCMVALGKAYNCGGASRQDRTVCMKARQRSQRLAETRRHVPVC